MSDQVIINDLPDWMYLPQTIDEMAVIVPMRERKLVKAKPDEFIRCQWKDCQGGFKGTMADLRKHMKTEHLKDCIEEHQERKKDILAKEKAGMMTREEAGKKLAEVAHFTCFWMVNGLVPCRDAKGSSDKERQHTMQGLMKHLGMHLAREGLPSPFVRESECCGHLFIQNQSRETLEHADDCENGERERQRRQTEEGT